MISTIKGHIKAEIDKLESKSFQERNERKSEILEAKIATAYGILIMIEKIDQTK